MNAKETRMATKEEFTKKVQELLRENFVGFTREQAGDLLEFELPNGQVFELKITEREKS